MKNCTKFVLGMAVSALALTATTSANAGSFALKERSTRAQGLSFAGATAGSGGLSSMGFNPAALGMVEDLELSGGLSFIQPIADGQVLTGPNAGQSVDPARFAGLTNGYVGYRLDPQFLIGLAMYTPFGLTTQYDVGDAPAADALTSSLRTIVFAPTVAYQPTPEITFGAAMNIMYVDARLTSVDAGALDGTTFDIGFGVGAIWQPAPMTQIGVAYEHGYNLQIPGTLNGVLGVEANAELPATISAGIVQGITSDIRVMGEVQWQNWSAFDRININSAVGFNASDPQNYDDAFFVALGGEYDVTDALTVRMGAAWDQTPTNAGNLAPFPAALGVTNRTARVPDEDRVWLSIGASYDVNDHMTLDLGYSYLFTLEDSIVGLRAAPGGVPTAQTGTQVSYEGGAHILSVGSTMKF